MRSPADPILTVAEMRAGEQALIDRGTSVDELMRIAGHGAGEWVWRVAAGRPVTVLCGNGNNGGDGYVIAELIRRRGGDVAVVAAREPATGAARNSRAAYRGSLLRSADNRRGGVFVDCLFGSGLTRPLAQPDFELLQALARSSSYRVAIDVPSGVDSDRGVALNGGLPHYELTLALGAWKFAHWTLPATSAMGALRLVDIGLGERHGVARLLARPRLQSPRIDAHKYSRGLLAVVGGTMPGASLLACRAAQRTGAGYVKWLTRRAPAPAMPPDLVNDTRALADALVDRRIAAVLVGPGLGRDDAASAALETALSIDRPCVLDADALVLLGPERLASRRAPVVLTPHEGEMAALERSFDLPSDGSRRERARALAEASGAVVVLKGPDSLIAGPGGALVCAPRASSWLSVAGTGDVLAGVLGARLAVGSEPVLAASEALWLHGEAAWRAGAAFTPSELADNLQAAFEAALE
jgi:hydroxyethylthiazole kinase-like uncharacterized protein yjeF